MIKYTQWLTSFRLNCYLIFAISVFFLTHTAKAETQLTTSPLKICWESELKPPYLTIGEQGQLQGIAVDWIAQIMKRENLKYQNVIMPWKRCLANLKRGQVDLVPNSSYKQSRSEFSHYSDELYRTHLAFYFLKDRHPTANSFNTIEQFRQFKIGGVRGFNYSFYDGLIDLDQGASNRRALIFKLKRKRIDFAILQKEVIESIFQYEKPQLNNISSVLAPGYNYKAFYVLVSKSNKQSMQILTQFNRGLKHLKAAGGYQTIKQSYLQ